MVDLALVVLLQAGQWTSILPLAVARQEVGVAAAEGRVYVIGGIGTDQQGSKVVEIFDTRTRQWRPGPPLPIPMHHPNVAAVGSKIYVAGGFSDPGFTPIAATFELDIDTEVWTARPNLRRARAAGAAVAYGGRLYVFGGDAGDRSVTDTSVYDPSTNQWTELAPMPTARNHMGAAVLRGRIYVVGGRPSNLALNEVYDPASNSWETKPPMPTPRSGHAVGGVGGSLIAFGGEGNPNAPTGIFPQVEEYNADLEEWTSLDVMPVPRHGIGVGIVGNAMFLPGGAVFEGYGATAQSDFFEVNEDVLLPQYVGGRGYSTEIVVTNPSSTRTAHVTISLTDFNGRPLETSALTIPPLASERFTGMQSASSASLTIGTARIRANVRLSAYATVTDSAGVRATVYPAGQARNIAFPIQQTATTGQTAVALLNTTAQSVSVTIALMNVGGIEVARMSTELAANEQLSRFIDEFFPDIRSGGFSGTVVMRANAPIAVLALQVDRFGVITLPVTPVD
jgi:N-acetylneuraminic acid mutarotase